MADIPCPVLTQSSPASDLDHQELGIGRRGLPASEVGMAVATLSQNPIGVPAMRKSSFRIDTIYTRARQPCLRRFDHIDAGSGTVGSANVGDPLSRARSVTSGTFQ